MIQYYRDSKLLQYEVAWDKCYLMSIVSKKNSIKKNNYIYDMEKNILNNYDSIGVFINISNHPSSAWNEKQLFAAKKYGEIIDLSFPLIDPYATTKEITELADCFFQKVMSYRNPVVMVQGEFTFSYSLIKKLRMAGIRVLAGCSIRKSEEKRMPDGSVVKQSIFEFVGFREYE